MASVDKCDKLYQQACIEGVSQLGSEEAKCLIPTGSCTDIHTSLSKREQEQVCRQLRAENLNNHREQIGVIPDMCSQYE